VFVFRKTMPLLLYGKHVFSISESFSFKGVQAVILDVDQYWPNKYLLLMNTHLDPKSAENRRAQLKEIKEFLSNIILQVNQLVSPMAIHERISSSFDEMQFLERDSFQKFSFKRCGVLLVGDFNIPSFDIQEYQAMLSSFDGSLHDLYREFRRKHSRVPIEENRDEVTYESGNSLFVPLPKMQQSRRIDYMLSMDSFKMVSGESAQTFLPLECTEFFIEKQSPGEELSDHWIQLAKLRPKA